VSIGLLFFIFIRSYEQHVVDPGVDGWIILRWISGKSECWGMEWIELAQDKDRWRAVENVVMNFLDS
jgi:hypothetical protein